MKRKVVACLCAGCCIVGLLTGCGSGFSADTTVLTVNDTNVSLDTMLSMLRYQQALEYDSYVEMAAMYSGQGMYVDTSQFWEMDLPESDEEADTSSVPDSGMRQETYADNLVNWTATELASYEVIQPYLEDYGVSLSDEEVQKIEEVAKTFCENTDKSVLTENHITEASMTEYLTLYTQYVKFQEAFMNVAEVSVTDEESEMMTLSYISFSATDELSDEDVKKQAEDFLATVRDREDASSVDVTSLITDEANASANTQSLPVNDTEDAYVFSTEDIKALSGLSDGEWYDGVLQDENGAYYIVRMDVRQDADASAEYKESLIQERKQEAFDAQLSEWMTDAVSYETGVLESIEVSDNVVYTGTSEDAEEDVSEDGVVTETQVGEESNTEGTEEAAE